MSIAVFAVVWGTCLIGVGVFLHIEDRLDPLGSDDAAGVAVVALGLFITVLGILGVLS